MRSGRGLSGTALQVVAVLSMTADHVGAVILRDRQIAWAMVLREMPAIFALRAIGRAAFPVFAFLLTQGMLHTRSRKRLIFRLALFAFLSELPFDLAFYGVVFYPYHQNIFFTLCLGAICIALVDYGSKKTSVVVVVILGLIAELLRTDYAALGVLTILMFWLLGQRGRWGNAVVLFIFTGSCLMYGQWIYLFSMLSLPLLLCYNGMRGGPTGQVGAIIRKWGFYFYYPAHLLVLATLAGR